MSIHEMEAAARELRQLQALIEEAQAEADALKDRLKAALGDAESVQAGEYRITWKAITSSRIDTAALKKALPDVAERFSIRSTTRRFSVTLAPTAAPPSTAALPLPITAPLRGPLSARVAFPRSLPACAAALSCALRRGKTAVFPRRKTPQGKK